MFVLQISEELEKVKQEMEEKGSSMSDGGNHIAMYMIYYVIFNCLFSIVVCFGSVC